MPKLGCGRTNEERFWSKLDRGGSCWLWTGATDKDGYGKFQINTPGQRKQKHVRAHRYAFFLTHGRWPEPEARHTCDVPACCRPDHLVEGTQAENRADTVSRGREPRGSKKTNAVLTEALVREARALAGERGAITRLARERGVPFNALYLAASGRGWGHV